MKKIWKHENVVKCFERKKMKKGLLVGGRAVIFNEDQSVLREWVRFEMTSKKHLISLTFIVIILHRRQNDEWLPVVVLYSLLQALFFADSKWAVFPGSQMEVQLWSSSFVIFLTKTRQKRHCHTIPHFLAPSGALIAIPTYQWPSSSTHFFRSRWSSKLDFHFLSHDSYIKGNHCTHLLATCTPYGNNRTSLQDSAR